MFIRTPVYNVNNTIVFGLRREVIAPDPTDSIIGVTQTMVGDLGILAYELYGTSELWWVIAELNHILDPMTEVVEGLQLRVPSRDRLFNILST
jgi:hypothetical protein